MRWRSSFLTESGTEATKIEYQSMSCDSRPSSSSPRAFGVISCMRPSTVTLVSPFLEMIATCKKIHHAVVVCPRTTRVC